MSSGISLVLLVGATRQGSGCKHPAYISEADRLASEKAQTGRLYFKKIGNVNFICHGRLIVLALQAPQWWTEYERCWSAQELRWFATATRQQIAKQGPGWSL